MKSRRQNPICSQSWKLFMVRQGDCGLKKKHKGKFFLGVGPSNVFSKPGTSWLALAFQNYLHHLHISVCSGLPLQSVL